MGIALLGAVTACSAKPGNFDGSADENATETSDELSRTALSNRQQAIVLKAVDDICGDTWCEGDHDFSFDRLECSESCGGHGGSCKLTFRVFSYDTDIQTGPTYARSCRTPGFTGFASLVETFGDYYSLQPAYYEALSECIGRVEAALPK
jgi:hypothetical protein